MQHNHSYAYLLYTDQFTLNTDIFRSSVTEMVEEVHI